MKVDVGTTYVLLVIASSFLYFFLSHRKKLKSWSDLLFFSFVCSLFLSGAFIVFGMVDATFKSLLQVHALLWLSIWLLFSLKYMLDNHQADRMYASEGDLAASLFQFFHRVKHEKKVTYLIHHLRMELEKVLHTDKLFHYTVAKEEVGWQLQPARQAPENVENRLGRIDWGYWPVGQVLDIDGWHGVVLSGNHQQKEVLVFCKSQPRSHLSKQEKNWLETIVYFSSILMENFERIEKLFDEIEHYKWEGHYSPWLSRLLFSLSEKERSNLAIDLHDSLLQEQLQLLRSVEKMSKKTSLEEIKKELAVLQESILDHIHLVRITCNHLQPPFLSEIGLVQSIQNYIDQMNLRSSFIIHASLDHSIGGLPKEIELTVYRVVQELFNNAMKHAEAENVTIELSKSAEGICLTYEDDGKGFDPASLQDSFNTMGLMGIQERVRSVGGRATIHSTLGQGVRAQIELKEGVG